MIRRLLVAAVVSAFVVWSGPAPARSKGSGSHAAKGKASTKPAEAKTQFILRARAQRSGGAATAVDERRLDGVTDLVTASGDRPGAGRRADL